MHNGKLKKIRVSKHGATHSCNYDFNRFDSTRNNKNAQKSCASQKLPNENARKSCASQTSNNESAHTLNISEKLYKSTEPDSIRARKL